MHFSARSGCKERAEASPAASDGSGGSSVDSASSQISPTSKQHVNRPAFGCVAHVQGAARAALTRRVPSSSLSPSTRLERLASGWDDDIGGRAENIADARCSLSRPAGSGLWAGDSLALLRHV